MVKWLILFFYIFFYIIFYSFDICYQFVSGQFFCFALFFTSSFLQRQATGFSALSLSCQRPATHITCHIDA